MKNSLIKLFKSPERNQVADLLKGIAVIFMIQVHITEKLLQLKIQEETFGVISLFLGGTPAAPVFMFVMGYFLSAKKNLYYFLERGIILFLGGILLNIGLNFYYLILYFQNQIINENPLEYIFGVDILPFAGLSLIIIGLVKEFFGEKYYLYLSLAVIVALLSEFIPQLNSDVNPWLRYVLSFVYGCSDWSYFPIFPWLFYPLVGFSFKLFSEKYFYRNRPIIFVPALIYLVVFAYDSFNQIVVLENYYHHGIMLAMWNFSFMVIWVSLFEIIEKKIGNLLPIIYLKWIGKNVTVIYVFQWLIIGNLSAIFYDSQNETQFFIWFVIILVSVSILTYMYERNNKKKLEMRTNE